MSTVANTLSKTLVMKNLDYLINDWLMKSYFACTSPEPEILDFTFGLPR